jgi:hypothetical protein
MHQIGRIDSKVADERLVLALAAKRTLKVELRESCPTLVDSDRGSDRGLYGWQTLIRAAPFRRVESLLRQRIPHGRYLKWQSPC